MHRLLDVDALDRDADLAGVVEPVGGRGVRGPLEVGVGEHDHRVLAAELEAHRGERLRRLRHHLLAGRDRAGEHHVVDLVDERRAGVAAAGGDREHRLGQAAVGEHLRHQQRGERRDLRRLEHHRVAGRERRDAVAERVRQRVVPGADHADDAERLVADDELAPADQRRGGLDLLVGRGRRAPAWPRTRAPSARRRSRRTGSRRPGRPVSPQIVATTRSAFATSQRRAASSTSARASKPASAQAGCAARAASTSARTSSGPSSGTVADGLAGGGVLDLDHAGRRGSLDRAGAGLFAMRPGRQRDRRRSHRVPARRSQKPRRSSRVRRPSSAETERDQREDEPDEPPASLAEPEPRGAVVVLDPDRQQAHARASGRPSPRRSAGRAEPKRIHDAEAEDDAEASRRPRVAAAPDATKPTSAATARKITFRIRPSSSIARLRVMRPTLFVGSRRGRPIRRRKMRSRPSSRRMAMSSHLAADVAQQADALRGDRRPDLGRLGDPLDQLLGLVGGQQPLPDDGRRAASRAP